VNAANSHGDTILHNAVIWKADLAIMQALLATPGANVDARDTRTGCTPLCLFCFLADISTDSQIIRAFVDAGANPNAADGNGDTPLSFAVRHCHVRAVEALLAAGADHRVRDNNNRTPLHFACYRVTLDVIQALMRREAGQSELEYITFRNNFGNTPLDCLGIEAGAAAAAKQFLLQTYSRLLLQLHGAGCIHAVLRVANQGFHRLPENDGVEFQLPIGTLDTEHLGMLLQFILEAQPDSIRTLNNNGLLPLQVAQKLDFPAEVLYVLLRPRPMDLFQLPPPQPP